MSDGFTELIDVSNAFFSDLAKNNRKDWFASRKQYFGETIQKPAQLLGEVLAQDLGALTGQNYACKQFRIYRDVRFSKDKTPYHTHLHLMWSAQRAGMPGWYFGSSPDYLIVGCGYMTLEKPMLARFRAAVDADGATLADALAEAAMSAGATLSDFGPAPLKRVPKPYAADHPQAELLKRKNLAVSAPLPSNWRQTGVVDGILSAANRLLPIDRWLSSTLS